TGTVPSVCTCIDTNVNDCVSEILDRMQKKEWATRTKHDRADSTTRAVLLTAARRVFEHSGYARTTVARITEEAGVGRATFYVYFSSKEEVFSVLAEQVKDSFLAGQELNGIDADDPHAVPRRPSPLSSTPIPNTWGSSPCCGTKHCPILGWAHCGRRSTRCRGTVRPTTPSVSSTGGWRTRPPLRRRSPRRRVA